MINIQQVPENPFEKIALSLSGGGYRAASFHLGTLSYLNHLKYKDKPLLENVKMLSTVSGGTITGAVYALMKAKGKSFPEIYKFIINSLEQVDLLKEGLILMQTGSKWDSFKRKNLINAFAQLYDKYLTNGHTFKDLVTEKTHLDAVVFNSTEFNNGLNFRFRTTGSGKFGNKVFIVPELAGEEVKLADAIAASSCFTGGFEPIRWPYDFFHEKSDNLKKVTTGMEPIGLMDGGIYDNQGIDSILLYKDGKKTAYFDLIIVSDVASPYMDPFTFRKEDEKSGWLKFTPEKVLQKIKRIITWFVFLTVLITIGSLVIPVLRKFDNSIWTGIFLGTSFFGISILSLYFIILYKFNTFKKWIFKKITSYKESGFYLEKLSHLEIEKISLRRISTLLGDRFNSLLTLLSNVFLKVIRRHRFNDLYERDIYEYRRITTLIKELTRYDFENKKNEEDSSTKVINNKIREKCILKGKYDEDISKDIERLVEETSSFGTTLWFTETDQAKNLMIKLIATGEVTMCYNMLQYLESLIHTPGNGFEKLNIKTQDEIIKTYKLCSDDWSKFKENPFSLLFNTNSDISS